MHTLGAKDFSLTVSGFCQAFIVTRAKKRLLEQSASYCFDSADPIISTVKSAGADFGHDGWLAPNDTWRTFNLTDATIGWQE